MILLDTHIALWLTLESRALTQISFDAYMTELQARFTVLPVTAAIAAATTRLPATYPRDSADRIIGATALVHGATLITADQRIRKAKGIRTLW